MLVLLFLGVASAKQFSILTIPIALLVPLLIIIEPYRLKRLMAFLNPWENPQGEGYQLLQSLYKLYKHKKKERIYKSILIISINNCL